MKEQPTHTGCRRPRGRISVLTVSEKSNHWRWIHAWLKRQNGNGDIHLWEQQKETQTSPKSFPLKQIFPDHMTKDDFLTDPWSSHLSHRLHPFRHTCVYGCCLHSPYIPGILHSLQKGNQVQLRDHEACLSEKGDSSVSNPICIQVRRQGVVEYWHSLEKWFPQILYWKYLYNAN